MKFKIPAKVLLLLMITSVFLNSCASTTTIVSVPENAKIYLNDSFVGYTPYVLKDRKLSLTKTKLVLKKEGYETFQIQLVKEGRVNVGAVIAGVLFWYPFVWIYKYEKEYVYEMEEVKTE